MSPRPKNIRKVNHTPPASGFRPIYPKGKKTEVISLHFEEYEAIRLCDYEMMTQQEASGSMEISRPTFSRIYSQARQKIAESLVRGLTLTIEGGSAYTADKWFYCPDCDLIFNNIRPGIETQEIRCPICRNPEIETHIENTNNIEKRMIMTKIAIPTRGNQVDNHFGHCEFYTILTIGQENQILSSETIPSPQGCGCKSNIAGQLEEMGVSVMLAGNMGAGALNVLTSHHIQVIRGCSGPIMEVAYAYLKGELKDSGEGCHHHEGEDGHVCHHHA